MPPESAQKGAAPRTPPAWMMSPHPDPGHTLRSPVGEDDVASPQHPLFSVVETLSEHRWGTSRERRSDKWLDRLLQAIQDDGVDYLCVVEDHWGDLCASPEVASQWADQFVDLIRIAWSDPRPGGHVSATSLCLSSLLAAGRHQDIWNLLAVARFPFWHYRKFGVDALVKEDRMEDALYPSGEPLLRMQA